MKNLFIGLFIPLFIYLALMICPPCDKRDANGQGTVAGEKSDGNYSPWVVWLSKEQA